MTGNAPPEVGPVAVIGSDRQGVWVLVFWGLARRVRVVHADTGGLSRLTASSSSVASTVAPSVRTPALSCRVPATAPRVPPPVRRSRATHTSTATPALRIPHFRSFWPRPTIMRHDPGLAASPLVRYTLRVERSGYSPFRLIVRCGRTASSRSGGAPRTALPSAQEDLPWADGCGPRNAEIYTARPRSRWMSIA
jgi:hypothetical protein